MMTKMRLLLTDTASPIVEDISGIRTKTMTTQPGLTEATSLIVVDGGSRSSSWVGRGGRATMRR